MKYIFSFFFTLAALSLSAQRVGVVFSGGGAKGLYHIGILKALEENNIPIDYIAGTSMGSIVGGLYAIGYTPQEMEDLFMSEQVKYWLTGAIESRYFFYFKRMTPDQAMVTLNLDFKSEKSLLSFPVNVVPSTQLDLSFNQIFAPATAYSKGDFSNLFIPFRCVASDVYNKKEVVFKSGDIGYAIRSSMSIPLVFKPMPQDTVMLYDGGMYNNFPWEVIEEDFDPDIIIGGKCILGRQNPNPDNIVEMIEALTMMHTDFNLPESKGIMVEREFRDVTMMDFSKARYLIDMGYRDTMEKMDSIKSRVSRRVSDQELYNKRLSFRSQLPELIFEDYNINGLNSMQQKYVSNLLGLDGSNKKFSFDDFKSEYFKLLSDGDIVADYPYFRYNDSTGYFTIDLNLNTKPSFKLKLGGNISSTSLNQAYVGLEYRILGKNAHSLRFDGNFSALYTSLRLGGRSEIYFKGPVYYELFFNYHQFNYLKSNYKNLYKNYGYDQADDMFGSFSTGFPTGRSSVFDISFNAGKNTYRYFDSGIFTDLDDADRTKFNYLGVKMETAKNTMNYTLYPTRGIHQSISVMYANGRERFQAGTSYRGSITSAKDHKEWFGAKYAREEYFPITRWLTFGYMVEGVYTNHPSFSNYHSTTLTSPAFTPTPHSQSIFIDAYRADKYIAAGVIPVIEFGPSIYLKTSGYAFQPVKYKDFEDRSSDRMKYLLNASLVYQTPLGFPASLSVSHYDTGRRSWFVVFNLGYTLFRDKGLFY